MYFSLFFDVTEGCRCGRWFGSGLASQDYSLGASRYADSMLSVDVLFLTGLSSMNASWQDSGFGVE